MYNFNGIDENQKIVRFVGAKYMEEKSDGNGNKLFQYTFPVGLLSFYERTEDHRGDSSERKVKIDLHQGRAGCHRHHNDVLVSCWSIFDNVLLENIGENAHFKNCEYVAISTVQHVVANIENEIIPFLNKEHQNQDGRKPILSSYYGFIEYYKLTGISLKDWDDRAHDISRGIGANIAYNIFSKEKAKFGVENECRFALVLNPWAPHEKMVKPEITSEVSYAEEIIEKEVFCNRYNLETA